MFGVGQRVGPYEILSELGRGGMATLYVGRQEGLGGFVRHVAIKVLHPDIARDVETQRMFLDEARLSASIRHPNVVHVETIAEHEGVPYLVMEYIRGVDLAGVLRARSRARSPLPVAVAVSIAAQVAEALHAAHESTDELGAPLGIVHRDVSPSNVLIDARGHVKLIDFGVARARTRLAKTMPGTVKGKLAYMAPEQIEGTALDRRVDVFALGIVLWEMLTLQRLFHGTSDAETIFRIRDRAPVEAPSRHRSDLPPRLDDVVGTMLARDLEERFSTTRAARHALLLTCPDALHVEPATIAAIAPAARDGAAQDGSAREEPTAPARPRAR